MKKTIVTFVLGTALLSAHAKAEPSDQWRPSETTLATLVQSGYRIVAVTASAATTDMGTNAYYLQRDASVFRCFERRAGRSSERSAFASLSCEELVQPFKQ
jgi:hypothetical protein